MKKFDINVFLTNGDKEYIENCLKDIKNGKEDDFVNIWSCKLENGFYFYIDLCSGTENYYLQYEVVDKDNNVVNTDVMENDLEDFTIVDIDYVFNVNFIFQDCFTSKLV